MEFAYFRALRRRNGRENVCAEYTRRRQRRHIHMRNRADDRAGIRTAQSSRVKVGKGFPNSIQRRSRQKRQLVTAEKNFLRRRSVNRRGNVYAHEKRQRLLLRRNRRAVRQQRRYSRMPQTRFRFVGKAARLFSKLARTRQLRRNVVGKKGSAPLYLARQNSRKGNVPYGVKNLWQTRYIQLVFLDV